MKYFLNFLALSITLILSLGLTIGFANAKSDTTNDTNSNEIASALIEESDFQALSKKMKQQSLGLLLMFHAENCPYCALMENEILSPMVKSGEYDKRIFIRKLQIDDTREITDFNGETVQPSDISDRYNASLTPTLVFLDADGNKQAETMVGINTVDYFGVYLDEEIDKMMQNLAKTKEQKKEK